MALSTVRKTISDTELLNRFYPPIDFLVPGLLPNVGLTIIGGKPKTGKSLTMTDLVLNIAAGGRFLGVFDVKATSVLYLCLEDTEARMQSRIKMAQGDSPATGHIQFAFKWDEPDPITGLKSYLVQHPETGLVVIDTLSRFLPDMVGKKYEKAYPVMSELKKIADTRRLSIVCVHHLQKGKKTDPFDVFYGSNALTGAADSIWILDRDRRCPTAKLIVTGRDIPDNEIYLKLDPLSLTWLVNDEAVFEYMGVEIKAVYMVLIQHQDVMKLSEISKATGFKCPVLSKYLTKLIEKGLVKKVGIGLYQVNTPERGEDVKKRLNE